MDVGQLLLGLHTFATVAMTGVIWFVQVVHYPLMAQVGDNAFVSFEAAHVRRTSFVVAPLMLAEAMLASWYLLAPPHADLAWNAQTGFALLAAVWLSTALIQVPCHRRLETGFDRAVVRRLVATNWIRTIAWTGRAALALQLVLTRAA